VKGGDAPQRRKRHKRGKCRADGIEARESEGKRIRKKPAEKALTLLGVPRNVGERKLSILSYTRVMSTRKFSKGSRKPQNLSARRQKGELTALDIRIRSAEEKKKEKRLLKKGYLNRLSWKRPEQMHLVNFQELPSIRRARGRRQSVRKFFKTVHFFPEEEERERESERGRR